MAPKAQLIIGTASNVAAGRLSLDIHLAGSSLFKPPAEPNGAAAEGSVVPVPDAHELHADIACGKVAACESKKERTVKQLQSHINYLQRTHDLQTGRNGAWNVLAQSALEAWLQQPTKGREKSPMPALEDKPQDVMKALPPAIEDHNKQDDMPNEGRVPPPAIEDQDNEDVMPHEIPKVSEEPTPLSTEEQTDEAENSSSSTSTSSSSTPKASSSVCKRRRLLQTALVNLESLKEVHPECHDCNYMIEAAMTAVKGAM